MFPYLGNTYRGDAYTYNAEQERRRQSAKTLFKHFQESTEAKIDHRAASVAHDEAAMQERAHSAPPYLTILPMW